MGRRNGGGRKGVKISNGSNNNRKKKNKNVNEEENDNGLNGVEIDVLPDDHTVAESVISFGGESFFDNDDDDDNEGGDIDDLLSATGKKVGAGDRAAAMMSNRHAKCLDAMNSIEETLLSEKRSSKRESGLKRLFRVITQYATSGETIIPYQDALVDFCINHCLRGGSPAEQYAACRVLEAYSVVLGADYGDAFHESIRVPLRRAVGMVGRATSVRNAALRALCLSNFIGNDDEVSTEALLDLCEEVAQKSYRNHDVPSALRATALECWCLLSTTIQDFYISGSDEFHIGRGLVMLSPLLQDCLDNDKENNGELKSAAGECLAIIHEARVNLGETDEEKNGTERRYGQGGWEGSQWEETIDYLTQVVVELSNQSGHYLSKKAKKEQRATFREFVSTILENESPSRVIAIGGTSHKITLHSWKEILQLDFIRHCLQGGFQMQIMTNPTLQVMFSLPSNLVATMNSRGDAYSQLEKRLLLSKNSDASKQVYMNRNKKRRVRNNVKNHFITTDGEDI